MADNGVYERLSAQFAVSEHATVNKGGGDQTYVPWTEYADRLNKELGFDKWSFRVVREGFTPTECWVLGEITATIDGVECVRHQYGCEPINKGRDAKPTTDLLKIAASDALKKAASLLGVGLYLSVKEERVAIQAAMRAEVQAVAKAEAEARRAPKAPTPISDNVRAAAELTGAPRQAVPEQPVSLKCGACETLVPESGNVNIQKNERGARVDVAVKDFRPVCEERLKGFFCGPCYDKRYWKKEGAA